MEGMPNPTERHLVNRQRLTAALDQLQATYERTRERLGRQNPHVAPEDMLNSMGEPILAGMLTPLVIGWAALVASPVADED